MRKAGLLVWRAHQIASEMIRPGVSTGEIDAAVAEHYANQGAEPLFLDYPNPERGKPPFPGVTCMSLNDEVVHGIPSTDRVLQEGDILSMDTGCRIDGWCGDAAVTHAIGEVDEDKQRLLDVTQKVLELAIELMAVKKRWSEVATEMAAFVADAGFATVEDFVGHGIGREMHEKPQVPNYCSKQLRGSSDFRLRPGVVIAIEPMVNIGTKNCKILSDYWTMVTADGSASAHFEHTVAMTQSGPRILTGPPEPDEPEWVDWGRERLPDALEREPLLRWSH